MECKFQIGQRVVCIKDGSESWTDAWGNSFKGPVYKSIHKILDMKPELEHWGAITAPVGGGAWLTFAAYPEKWFASSYFRPLQEKPKQTSIDVFKKLIEPFDNRVSV